MSFRICNAGKTSSCQHTADQVLDYPGSSKIEKKISDQCDGTCQDLKQGITGDMEDIEKKANKIFFEEEKKAGKTIKKLNEMSKKFATMHMAMVDKTTLAGVNKLNADFQEVIQKSDLSAKDKADLVKSTNNAAAKGPNGFKNSVESAVLSKSSETTAKKRKITSRRVAFKASISKAKKGVKKYGSAGSMAKASRAAAGAARGISKFMSARKPDGSIDEKKVVGGVLDVVDTIATFLPPPASIITGKPYLPIHLHQ